MEEIVEHLREQYRMYSIHFDNGQMILVHIGRPVSFKTVCDKFIFEHIELSVEKTNQKFETNKISGIQKIPNQNKPAYELRMGGILVEVL